jgi:hypothetical protein
MKTKKIFSEKVQGACKRGTAAMLCIVLALATTSCVKQRNCDCGETGTFTSYKEPQSIIVCGSETTFNASFVADDDGQLFHIVGDIPKAFQNQDSIRVRVCFKRNKEHICVAYGVSEVYKLKCIERE